MPSEQELKRIFEVQKKLKLLQEEANLNMDKSLSKQIKNYNILIEKNKEIAGTVDLGTQDWTEQADLIEQIADGQKDLSTLLRDQAKFRAKGRTDLAEIADTEIKRLRVQGLVNASMEGMDSITGGMFSKVKDVKDMFGQVGGKIGLASMGITAAAAILVSFNAKLDAIGEQFGAIGLQSNEMTSNLMATEQEAARLGFEMKDVLTASSQLTDNFAISLSDSIALSGEVLDMGKALGVSTEEAGNLIGQFKTLLGSTAKQSIALAKNVTLLAKANDVAPQQVLRDMANASEAIAKFTDKTGENMARASIQARKFGQSLSDVASQAEGLLDFQSSITKSMEASVLIGKNINNQKLMELSLSGDLEGFQKEQLKQLKNIGFAELDNVLAKNAAAEALGLSVDQAQKMVNLTEEVVSLSGQLAGQPGFDELIGSEGISDLTKMNNALKSMGAILVNALGPALNVILVLLNGVFSLVDVFMESTGINTLLRLAGGQGLSYKPGEAVSRAATGIGLADGGIVTDRVDNVTMGEAGPEAVVPLDKFMSEFRTLKSEMTAVKDAVKSLKLTTKITNRDLNIILTPSKTG